MTDLWTTLIPLAITSAVDPFQLTITLLLLRSAAGATRTAAFVAGLTVVRLGQYAVFGAVLDRAMDDSATGTSPAEGAILLLVAVFLLVSAARKLAKQPDEDAPPPSWLTLVDGASAGRSFVMGIGLAGLSPKLWAFTLGAIGAISDSEVGPGGGWAVYLVWVALAQSLMLVGLVALVLAPTRTAPLLARAGDLLERYSRPILIGLCLVLGIWFLLKALFAFGF